MLLYNHAHHNNYWQYIAQQKFLLVTDLITAETSIAITVLKFQTIKNMMRMTGKKTKPKMHLYDIMHSDTTALSSSLYI